MAISGFFPTVLYVSNGGVALGAAFVLTVLNLFVKPLLSCLSVLINLLTMGLFSFVINGIMLELTSAIMGSSFTIASFWSAILVAMLMSLINTIISNYFQNE